MRRGPDDDARKAALPAVGAVSTVRDAAIAARARSIGSVCSSFRVWWMLVNAAAAALASLVSDGASSPSASAALRAAFTNRDGKLHSKGEKTERRFG